jgi:hypothetical protein
MRQANANCIEKSAGFLKFLRMKGEIAFTVEYDGESGWLSASWDAPKGGGISTQGRALSELEANIIEAVRCHFEEAELPETIRLHFVEDPILSPA